MTSTTEHLIKIRSAGAEAVVAQAKAADDAMLAAQRAANMASDAYRAQETTIAKLEARLTSAKAKVEALSAAGDAKALEGMESYARLLSGQLAKAKAQLDTIANAPPPPPPEPGAAPTTAPASPATPPPAAAPTVEIPSLSALDIQVEQAKTRVSELTAQLQKMSAEGKSPEAIRKVALDAASAKNRLADLTTEKEKLIGKKAAIKDILGGDLGNLASAATEAGGPLGALGAKAQKVASVLGKGGTAGAVLVLVAAFVALTTAAFAAVAALAAFGLASADAARHQKLLYEGMMRSVSGGDQLYKSINGLLNKVPLTADELAGLAQQARAMGYTGAQLNAALEKMAIRAATLKFGPNFAKEMLSLDVQARRLRENFAFIFSDLKIEPVLQGLHTLAMLFDQSTASGRALKTIVETMLNPLYAAAGPLTPILKNLFRGALIAALQFAIIIKTVSTAIKALIPDVGGISGAMIALTVGKVILYSILVVVGLLAAAFGVVVIAVLTVMGPLYALAAVIVGAIGAAIDFVVSSIFSIVAAFNRLRSMSWGEIGQAIGSAFITALLAPIRAGMQFGQWIAQEASNAVQAVQSALSALASIDLADIGRQIINGLISGITSMAGAVGDVVSGIAGGIKSGFAGALGIHSPSTVFAGYGVNIGAGVIQGAEEIGPEVQASVNAMVATPTATPIAAAKGEAKSDARAGASRSFTLQFYDCVFGESETAMRAAIAKVVEAEAQSMEPVGAV